MDKNWEIVLLLSLSQTHSFKARTKGEEREEKNILSSFPLTLSVPRNRHTSYKKNFFFLTFSYVVSIIWKCKALSTGCLSNSLSILVGAQKGLANESAINSHALTEKGNMPSARHIPRFSAHCRHGDWWCSSLMWDDCQLFLNKYKKKQRNLHPFQPEWIISYFPGLRIHGAWKLKVNNEP